MIKPETRRLALAKNFAAYTSLLADGSPMTIVTWVDCDDDHVLINTEVHRKNFRNVSANPHVCVLILDSEDSDSYVEVRGLVVDTVAGDFAREHIEGLAQRYMGTPYDEHIHSERVVLKIAPSHQRVVS